MQRAQKVQSAEALAAVLREPSAVFSFDFRGLDVAQVTDLRRRVREAGGQYRVVKNSTARWAFKDAGIVGLDDQLVGMTGLAWVEADPASLAKVLHESARDLGGLRFKGGVIQHRFVDEAAFEALARLPGEEVLRGQVVSMIAAPIRNLMNVLEGVPRNLVLVLKAAEAAKAEGDGAPSA